MTRRKELDPLVRTSGLILDLKLADLRRASLACEESRARLADLATGPVETDLPFSVAAKTGLLYDRWAEARRAEINLTLARQTATWIDARMAARIAFGRAEALRKLAGDS